MRFPLKLALSAVLAKGIVAELTHMPQTKQLPNELDIKVPTQTYRQAAKPETVDSDLYDSTKAVYQTYTKPDPVQQYATSYNPEQDINAEASDQLPAYLDPIGNYQPYSAYSGIVPYAGGNVGGYNPGAFAVQSGYEGYLVPGPPQPIVEAKKEVASRNNLSSLMDPISSTISAITRNLPGSMMFGRSLSFIMGLLGVTVFGGTLTTAICTFTPLCTISFALPFAGLRSGFKELAKNYVGPENADMLDKAIDKFTKMETQERAKVVAKSESPITDSDLKVDDSVPVPSPKAAIAEVDKEKSVPNIK